MVGNIQSGWTFAVFGIGAEIVTVAGLFVLFKKRGWF
jgi:hypothetical protein